MQSPTRRVDGWVVLLLLGHLPAALAAPGDTTADAVLGQTGMTQSQPNQPTGLPTASNLSLSNASHLAISPGARLYVSDPGNNRILSWPSAASYTTGQASDFVIGQPNFVNGAPNNGGVSASSLFLPQGLWVDPDGNLWVADAFNSRVLKFNNPSSDATPTQADLVIGQPDFVSRVENLGQGGSGPDVALIDSLMYPGRVLAVGTDVWVADSGNSRVLHYTNPTGNKPLADRVFGQFGNFQKRAKNNDGLGNPFGPPSADNLYNPIGIAVDSAGSLYVADWVNNRVLRYDNPIAGDMTADAVIGQPDFTNGGPDSGGPTSGLERPIDLALDPSGNLFIADSSNNRVLVYFEPRLEATPDRVFGQLGSFAAQDPNHGLGETTPDADGLDGPTGVKLDAAGNVHVVDTDNQRILRYYAPLVLSGDVNCDGYVNAADAPALVLAMTNPAGYHAVYPTCDSLRCDLDADNLTNGNDIQPFVALLLGP